MDKIYGICFNKSGKIYYFSSDKKYDCDQAVIVETEKGEQYGKIVNELNDKIKISKLKELKKIIRKATKEDDKNYLKNLKDADLALKKCKEIVSELNLNMNFVNASYTFNRKQLIFNFYADERIDFRELVKKLSYVYKTRIELRQIGARDKAKEVCGIGVCGQKLCCSRFLNQIETVTINMAKNQNLALNPSKINGACNRLLCCLSYEDDVYSEYRKKMPNIGQKIDYNGEKAVVKSIDVLNSKYTIQINNERIEVSINEDNKK